jgi:hypothetical protein
MWTLLRVKEEGEGERDREKEKETGVGRWVLRSSHGKYLCWDESGAVSARGDRESTEKVVFTIFLHDPVL